MSKNFYEHSIILPFSGKNIDFREINSSEEYILSKFNKNSTFGLFENLLFKVIKNCVKQVSLLEKINILDYVCLCISLRIKSFGNIMQLTASLDKEEANRLKIQKINFSLDLTKIINNIKEFKFKDNLIICEDLSINLDWPLVQSYFLFLDKPSQEALKILEFIKSVSIKDKIFEFKNLNQEEKIKIWDKLPAKVFIKISKVIDKNLNSLLASNLTGIERLNFLSLNFLKDDLEYFSKLLFQNVLKNLLNEYLILSKNGISLDFIFKSDVNLKNNLLEHISYMDDESKKTIIVEENILTGLEGLNFDEFIIKND